MAVRAVASPDRVSSRAKSANSLGKGARAVFFIQRLKLTEGNRAGQPFVMTDCQNRVVRKIFGDTDENGYRKIRTVFMLCPRGWGKTTWGIGTSAALPVRSRARCSGAGNLCRERPGASIDCV